MWRVFVDVLKKSKKGIDKINRFDKMREACKAARFFVAQERFLTIYLCNI